MVSKPKEIPSSYFFFLAFIAKPCLFDLHTSIAMNSLFESYFFVCVLLPMVKETFARILSNQPKIATHFDNPTLQVTTKKLNGHDQGLKCQEILSAFCQNIEYR